jgi:hypothetical protein
VSAAEAALLCSLRVDPEAPAAIKKTSEALKLPPAAIEKTSEALKLPPGCHEKRGWRRTPGTDRAVPLAGVSIPHLNLVGIQRSGGSNLAHKSMGPVCDSSDLKSAICKQSWSTDKVSLALSIREAATNRCRSIITSSSFALSKNF